MESLLMLGLLLPASAGLRGAEVTVDPATDKVSVAAIATPRDALVAEIARLSGLRLVSGEPASVAVSIAFRDLPLALALRRILGERGFVLEHRAAAHAGARPRRLWILPAGGHPPPDREPPATAVDRRARLAAVAALASADPADAISALEAALNDPDPAVRREAVHALTERGDPAGTGLLAQALSDPDPGVRRRAAEALGDSAGEGAAPALAQALDDADPDLRQEAVDALAQIGGADAEALLHQALADADPAVRQAAAEGLIQLGTDQTIGAGADRSR